MRNNFVRYNSWQIGLKAKALKKRSHHTLIGACFNSSILKAWEIPAFAGMTVLGQFGFGFGFLGLGIGLVFGYGFIDFVTKITKESSKLKSFV